MPGYIMHLCEAAYILDKIKIKNSDEFILGCVLPDAVASKDLTHFRPRYQDTRITKYPDMEYVMKKYNINTLTPADLGVISHLQMDALYVSTFWPKFFTFEDNQNQPTEIHDNITHVRMKDGGIQKEGTCIPLSSFFSQEYFYGDYNATNSLFIKDFNPRLPAYYSADLTITECLSYSEKKLKEDLTVFTAGDNVPAAPTKVFHYSDLKDFIISCGEAFINLLQV